MLRRRHLLMGLLLAQLTLTCCGQGGVDYSSYEYIGEYTTYTATGWVDGNKPSGSFTFNKDGTGYYKVSTLQYKMTYQLDSANPRLVSMTIDDHAGGQRGEFHRGKGLLTTSWVFEWYSGRYYAGRDIK